MRALETSEILQVFGGTQYNPSVHQLHHKDLYSLPGGFDRWLQDSTYNLLDIVLGIDAGMTTYEREAALQSQFSPDNVALDPSDSSVGYSTDGTTTYFDQDGNGAWDTALRRGSNGTTYIFGHSGWAVY